ncbi:phosphate starvation-induced protein [Fictibacillus macauensis ZFHKF-1]|uniref:Phosphate starvation-induced protein n=1 Tax=Fictibacillus macauensis ZFHKF-1 TaxID=1196324 RepID=I8AGW3_9BACL|nr:PhoH family protein [Fictibacillus macauensis]EIT84932.1 phosphate starvation-induced protein [Fictibacillus macauensis ZFHKF-1]
MSKIYVLDTNVLLQDPHSIFSFGPNEVVLPAIVLEEVDSKKRYMDEIGRNAREVSRLIDKLRTSGTLHQKVPLGNGGFMRVELNRCSFDRLSDTFVEPTNDNKILAVTLHLQNEEETIKQKKDVILVSKDVLVRVKADALGIIAEDFLSDRVVERDDQTYTGYKEIYISGETMNKFYDMHELTLADLPGQAFYPHQFVIMKDLYRTSVSALAKVDEQGKKLKPLVAEGDAIWGIKPRNVQQKMAIELLLRKDIPLVTMIGKAGTGKTLLTLAAGLLQTEDLKNYIKLFIARPIVPIGKDIGYLPGEKDEKLKPWMQPIYDNLEYLFNAKKQGELEKILAGIGSIHVEALTYIRGRSLPDQFIIIDEAQNLTKHEVKTILTRAGEGSKVILLGDPKQIDHPYLDEFTNGLTYVVEKFKDQAISGHVKLEKGERSTLAQLAADLL